MKEKKQVAKNKKKKPIAKFFKILFISLLSIFILGGFALLGVGFAIINTAPELDLNQILSLNETSKLYDSNDKLMDNVVTDEYRTTISVKDMPNNLTNAFKSIEDERFEKHNGVDFKRVAGALFIDIKNKITKKSGLQGGSTITQQLIKNKVLGSELSAKRKVQEMYLAMELEKKLEKNEILEAYLNTIWLGGKSYGVEAAANNYFGKTTKDLSLLECAFTAGIPQSPSRYYSYIQAVIASKNDPKVYSTKDSYVIDRTKAVLSKLHERNCISKEQYDTALKDLKDQKLVFKGSAAPSNRLAYEWFSLPAIEQVKADLKKEYKLDDKQADLALMYNGLRIYTTMDKSLQDAAQKVIDDNNNYGGTSKVDEKTGIVQPQASAVIMDYHTGEVKTIIGGRGTQPARSYNRAAYNGSSKFIKPVGSSIKPLTVYSAAIDSRAGNAGTVVEDSPLPVEIGKLYPDGGKPYNPRNYETGSFTGYVTTREAITSSINLVAIKLEHQLGLKTGAQYGEKFGLPLNNADKTSISALSLGEINGTNTLTMAAAYGTFGNNGLYTGPKLYRKVVDRTGKVILENKTVNKKVLSPQSAYVMYDLLKGPVEWGTATNAKLGSMPAAGKTGTSSEKKNFWFCGLTPYYSGAIWIGNDTPKTYNWGIGSNSSAAIWRKIMVEAHKNLQVKDIEAPSGLVRAAICRESGKLPTEACAKDPRGDMTYSELFIEGTIPTTFCDIHTEAKINKNNNKLATEYTPAELILSKVFIIRDYAPSEPLEDDAYVLPKEKDDSVPPITPVEPKQEHKR